MHLSFLSYLHAVERSPNTVRAYAHDLRDYFEFLGQVGVCWSAVGLEDLGRFVAWIRLPPAARGAGVAALPSVVGHCSARTVNRKLSVLSAFYQFHYRHGNGPGDLLGSWQRGRRGGSWQPLLAHLGPREERSRVIRLGEERELPQTLDAEQVASVIDACDRLRDRLLLTLLAEATNSLYKSELIRGPGQGPWRSVDDVELATLAWVHWFNTERLHGTLNDLPPIEFETAYHHQTEANQPVGIQ